MKHFSFGSWRSVQRNRLAWVGCALLAVPVLAANDAPPFELKDGDRVLFMGDTFFEREVDYGHIETRLTAAFPDRNITFRNLGWAADTPLGKARASFDWNKSEDEWLKRVKQQVALVKPTVAFLSYGMTAALEGGEPGILKFKADMNRLMDTIEEVSGRKVRFVLLGRVLFPPRNQAQMEALEQVDDVTIAYDHALQALATERDAHYVGFIQWARATSIKWMIARTILNDGGTAPNDFGHFLTAGAIGESLGWGEIPEELGSDKAPGQVLRSAIRKKNELFFYRWRPANWTYLLGHRKHEQGQNAAELPEFEPLMAQWEARIAKLRDLKNQDPATVREVSALLAVEKQRAAEIPSPTKPQPHPTFTVAEGFEVNLWAETPMLSKPIQMNFDERGRLWIATSETYPQIAPGQPARDKVIVLEDTNEDGVAETFAVFADGLLIPSGVLPDGRGGCYVAASHQLLHFADTDGDGRADRRSLVLSSFGTEDTHHNLHTLRWGYDGHIYMNQSIYTHSHIETPHGVVRLNSGGIWRFDPREWRLEIFTKGGCNPWGHHWDDYGNSFFTDGAGASGIYHAVPGAMYFTYAGARRELSSISPGNYPKFCALEVVRSQQFPDDWQGDFITCDFRAQRIVRFKNSEVGSSFQTREMPDLLRSTNVTFRPIDVRFGPDGALYIADWSNPIIQHGEVDFRDPRRDHEHGRIWRVTTKGQRLARRQDLAKLSTTRLLDGTLSPNGWVQEQARRVLSTRNQAETLAETEKWLARQTEPRATLEALWLFEAFGEPNPELTAKLLSAGDGRLRAAGARQLSR